METPVKIATTGGKHDAEYLGPGGFNQKVGGINLAIDLDRNVLNDLDTN